MTIMYISMKRFTTYRQWYDGKDFRMIDVNYSNIETIRVKSYMSH